MEVNISKRKALVLLTGITISVILNLSCDLPIFFRRNPNLKLLLRKDGYSAFNPVVSPDGNKVFYLLAGIGDSPKRGGQLRVINIDGSNDRLIREGPYGALAISPDGTKLALTTGRVFYDTSFLIVTDTSGSEVDTLPIEGSIKDAEFSNDGNEIYYFRNGHGFYKFNFIDSTEVLILSSSEEFVKMEGFDIGNDSLLFFNGILYSLNDNSRREYSKIRWPQFSPQNLNTVIGTTSLGFSKPGGDLYLLKIDTNFQEELNSNPYKISTVIQPYWFPCGKKIVFAANDQTGRRASPIGFELWILEKIK